MLDGSELTPYWKVISDFGSKEELEEWSKYESAEELANPPDWEYRKKKYWHKYWKHKKDERSQWRKMYDALEEWHADDVNGMGRCEYGDIEWDAKYIKKQWSKVKERLVQVSHKWEHIKETEESFNWDLEKGISIEDQLKPWWKGRLYLEERRDWMEGMSPREIAIDYVNWDLKWMAENKGESELDYLGHWKYTDEWKDWTEEWKNRLEQDGSSLVYDNWGEAVKPRMDRWGRKIEDSEWEMMYYYDRLNHDFAAWKPRGLEDAMLIKTWNELYVGMFKNLHWLTRQRLVILMKMNQIQHRIYEWREKVWDLILRLGVLGVKWDKIVKLVEVLCPYKPYFKKMILEQERRWKRIMNSPESLESLFQIKWNRMDINRNPIGGWEDKETFGVKGSNEVMKKYWAWPMANWFMRILPRYEIGKIDHETGEFWRYGGYNFGYQQYWIQAWSKGIHGDISWQYRRSEEWSYEERNKFRNREYDKERRDPHKAWLFERYP